MSKLQRQAGCLPLQTLDLNQRRQGLACASITGVNAIQEFESGTANESAEVAWATFESRRLAREWKTMQAMVRIYCNSLHGTSGDVCAECRDFLGYASRRLERCRFGPEKPTCANCPVHCYQRARRDQVKVIMRYAGPRMLLRHPLLSLCHWIDGFRKAPAH